MITSRNTGVLLALLLILHTAAAQQRRVVDFTGGARSLVTNNNLSVSDTIPDTTTVDRNSGGYALIDLGVNIRPNSTTELMGMFRIRNGYGGFWGAGVTFDVRQLWLKGIIGNVVRYQVGDLNLKQTPFTLYNHHADRFDSLPDVFALQSDIVDYEKFYTGNTWRQQGVNVDFGLTFAKVIKELNFTGYMTRMNATDFISVPDRLLAGFSAVIVQQEGLDVGFHKSTVFNVQGTAAIDESFTNDINSITTQYKFEIHDFSFDLNGEIGNSQYSNSLFPDLAPLEDYFLYGNGKMSWKKKHLSINLGYLNVGPDYRSIGAQSKDIDYAASPNFYNLYTNEQINRPLDLVDVMGNENLYLTSVSDKLMTFNPAINNVTPYGLATFNRLGAFAGASYFHPKGISLTATRYQLREIRGQGTYALKHFTKTDVTARLRLDQWINWEKKVNIHASYSLQTTDRKGITSLENVRLTSNRIQAGAEVELVKNLDLMVGVVHLKATGNEFLAERDDYTTIDFFENIQYNLLQNTNGAGIRYRFDNNTYLSALYQVSRYNDRTKSVPEYTIDQFSLIFNMTF